MRKAASILLAIALLSLAFNGIPVYGQESGNIPERITYKFLGTSPTGENEYIILDKDGNPVEKKTRTVNDTRDRALPSSYDLRNVGGAGYVTGVKDQGDYGTCWTFAAVGALESNLIKQGLATTSVNLSELHTAWFAYTPDPVPESTTFGDGNTYTGSGGIYNEGGTAATAYCLWGSAEGLQTETNAPYSKVSDPTFFTETQRKESYYRLKEAYDIPNDDINAVKSSIMANGALYMSFLYNDNYYKSSTGAYYNPNSTASGYGHAVIVVGWNDSYSASNFKTPPPSDGAYLCRNSWGTAWGNSGYFWVSYSDNGIRSFSAFIGDINTNYDNYIQYERENFSPSLENDEIYLSNVFTASYYSQLKAVAFRMYCNDSTQGTPGFDYEIKLYRGNATEINPVWGTPVPEVTTTGHCDYGGFYTVKLAIQPLLEVNDKYSIVIHFKSTAGEDGRLYFGGESFTDEDYIVNSGINSAPGQSFWSTDNTTWVDTYGDATLHSFDLDGNFPIKAMTNMVNFSNLEKTQMQLDLIDGCSQGSATAEQWAAFNAAKTTCIDVINNIDTRGTTYTNAIIRLKVARENAPGITYPTSPDFTLSINNGIATITSYTGTASCVKIPKALNGCALAVGATAFNGNTKLKIVYVEKYLASFSTSAFNGCTNFQFIYFMGNAPAAVIGPVGTSGPTGVKTYYRMYGVYGFVGNSLWGATSYPMVPGDFNADTEMNMKDAVLLVQRLAQCGTYIDYERATADLTRDGEVNMADIVKMVQVLANPSLVVY